MKQKLRKFTNGFYPNARKDTDIEEMADRGSDSFRESDNKDTTDRLSQLLSRIKSNHKEFTGEDRCEIISQLKEEIRSEQAWLSSLNHDIDTVAIYKVAQWTREKIETELAQYKDLLAEMDTHEEIIKLLSNITDHLNKVDNEDDSGDATSLIDDIKKIQTNLYKLWLRLLEWECLLEQQQLGHLKQSELLADNNEEVEELFRISDMTSNILTTEEDINRKSFNILDTDVFDSLEPLNDLHESCDDNESDILVDVDRCENVSDQQCKKNDQNLKNVKDKYFVTAGLHPSDHQISFSHQSFSESPSLFSLSTNSTSSSPSPASLSTSLSSQKDPCAEIDPDDSDSGVSDLSSDPTFYKNINTFSILNYTTRGKEVLKSKIDSAKKSKTQRKFKVLPSSRESLHQLQESFQNGILYWIKLILLIMVVSLLILSLLILSHVKCFNDICAISLETHINYQRYSSPI